jgi:hypothetical protein
MNQKRNISPIAPALVAMALWNNRYGAQRGGSMDFWDTLSDYEKRTCTELAEQIRKAPMAERTNREAGG